MIVDAFLYAGEEDMLRLRVLTLRHYVDRFIAVQCSLTHQSEPIEGQYNGRRSIDFTGVEYVTVNAVPYPEGERGGVGSRYYQQIERQHRDGIRDACEVLEVPADAWVCVSDVDEIPDPVTLIHSVNLLDPAWYVFEQRFHSTRLWLLHPQQPWLGTTMAPMDALRPQEMRDARGALHESGRGIKNGGWHLSWMGTDTERQRKLDTFSHAELRGRFDPAEGVRGRYHANGEPLEAIDPHAFSWPKPITRGDFESPESWTATIDG